MSRDTLSDDEMKGFSIEIVFDPRTDDDGCLTVIHMPCGIDLTGDHAWEALSFQEIADMVLKHDCPPF